MKHGRYPLEYGSWENMLSRCRNHNLPQYKNYGGRGIKVCERWHDFATFLADVGPRPTPQHTLDRVDNDRDYEPGNVRWATRKEQANNTRRCRWYEWRGEKLNMAQLADLIGLSRQTLKKRLNSGWPLERAMAEPAHSNKRQITA